MDVATLAVKSLAELIAAPSFVRKAVATHTAEKANQLSPIDIASPCSQLSGVSGYRGALTLGALIRFPGK